jgi:pimeloyl-ACP methyl ester carboxylesterase
VTNPKQAAVRQVMIDGGATHVRVTTLGDPDGRASVLVAGRGASETSFERLAAGLGELGPVHLLELPGFAAVPRFRGPVSIERYAEAVERVLDEIGLDDPVLVGHSMGSQIVTEVAARRAQLSDIVLVSPVVDSAARTVSESIVRLLRSARHEPAVVRWPAITAYVFGGWHWFRHIVPQMLQYPIERRAAAVAARTLIIRGEHDALVPRAWVRRLARVFPHAVLREVVGGGHSVQHAHGDAVSWLILAHVRGDFDDRGVSSLRRVRDETTGQALGHLSAGAAWGVARARLLEAIGAGKRDESPSLRPSPAPKLEPVDGGAPAVEDWIDPEPPRYGERLPGYGQRGLSGTDDEAAPARKAS